MNEDTVLKTMWLPYGQRFAWFADANVLALSSDLQTPQEREDAISEAVVHWRRNFIRAVPDERNVPACDPAPTQATIPLPDRLFPLTRLPSADLTP